MSYGTPAQPQLYTGQLTNLSGGVLQIATRNKNGQPLALSVTLHINGARATGQLSAATGAAGGQE